MASPILVSIVIVNWNAKNYLAECLASLNEEACRFPMEIIVVDNASADGSQQMVEQQFPQVKLIKNSDNLGFAKANNIGIKASTGNYIALVNSDVHVLKDCLTKLIEHCEIHPEIGMIGPRIIGGDGNQQRSCRGFPTVANMLARALALDAIFPNNKVLGGYFMTYWDHGSYAPIDILSGCFWLTHKKALDEVGLLDDSFFIYGEDMDWCKRYRQKGWPLLFFPEAEAIHYGGASSANAPIRFFIEKQRADFHYWEKHHSKPEVYAYFAITCLHHGLRVIGHLIALAARKEKPEICRYKMRRGLACLKWILSGRGAVPETI